MGFVPRVLAEASRILRLDLAKNYSAALVLHQLGPMYREVRAHSLTLCDGLSTEDYCIQPAAEASPPKWHLAHTTWFFETFLLLPHLPSYRRRHEVYGYLFNSYYEGIGEQWPREDRGKLSRPTVAEVLEYRDQVDAAMIELLEDADVCSDEIGQLTVLGLHHEQQHQELLVTDIKRNLGVNPLAPALECCAIEERVGTPEDTIQFVEFDGGLVTIGIDESSESGADFQEFSFDNESPRHQVYLQPYAIATRLCSNGEYLEFMNDGGYKRPELWLAEAWNRVVQEQWNAPLYWTCTDGEWLEYRLSGQRPLCKESPVAHLSYFEADAFARWQGARLPTEAEWEASLRSDKRTQIRDAFGTLWQWTASAYSPYPGYRPWAGAVGEYNGKFMSGQMVLRGSSCATPDGHARASYRNFFYPWDRWQYSGVRLARNIEE